MLSEKMRRGQYHISDDVPSLIDISIKVVADNFERYPSLPGLRVQSIIDKIIDQVSVTLDIKHTAPTIDHESYWKKACEFKWKVVTTNYHGWSWKQTYLEKHMQEIVSKLTEDDVPRIIRAYENSIKQIKEDAKEGRESAYKDKDSTRRGFFSIGEDDCTLLEALTASRNYIFGLELDELPSHLDLRVLFGNIPCLNRLKVTFGAKHLGSEYDRSHFGMRMTDAAALTKCIKNAQCLSFLSLPCNLIDDELVKMLSKGFLLNKTLIELDLSHNRIGDHGARRIAKFLFHTQVLLSLNLSDNQIQYEGSRCIGQALRNNRSLQVLNLKHNRLDDKSGAKLCNDLQQNLVVRSLNLSSNMLSSLFCDKLSELLSEENSLLDLDISCNLLVDQESEESIKDDMIRSVEGLCEVLKRKCMLFKLDIRSCGLPKCKV